MQSLLLPWNRWTSGNTSYGKQLADLCETLDLRASAAVELYGPWSPYTGVRMHHVPSVSFSTLAACMSGLDHLLEEELPYTPPP